MLNCEQENEGKSETEPMMDLQIDIYQCGSNHVHVILQGQAEGMAAFVDFEVFAKFIEACQQFINRRTQVPEIFIDAFEKES
jgi:hypothetical protein